MPEVANAVEHYPVYEPDVFSDEALLDPWPHYEAIRNLGPVVRLKNPHVLALSRYQDVLKALQSAKILVSGQGTGFNNWSNRKVEAPGVLNSDGERHQKMRMPLMKYLFPVALKPFREQFREMIDTKVASLVGGGTIDAISEIAAHLPLNAVSELVGLPAEHRERMVHWSAAGFNVLGPIERDGKIIPKLEADLALAAEVVDYIHNLDPNILRPGSWSAELFKEVRAGGMSLADARVSLRSFILPSLDTTINSTGHLLHNLGRNPDQYEMLRKDPSLVSSAVFEGMRHTTIVRWFSRVAVEDYREGDVFVPAGERIMVMFGSANRDPRKYENPDRFDVTRNPVNQLGWSAGPHVCAGQHLARMEMELTLEALLKHAARIEIDEPIRPVNRGLYAIKTLPMRLFTS